MRPFRVLAAILLLIAAGEIVAIHNTPTYEAELKEAQARYESAVQLNKQLRRQAHDYSTH